MPAAGPGAYSPLLAAPRLALAGRGLGLQPQSRGARGAAPPPATPSPTKHGAALHREHQLVWTVLDYLLEIF